MKRISFALGVILITLCLAIVGCKKDRTEEEPVAPSSPSLASVQAEYYPLEVALYDLAGASTVDGTYTGTFNGQSIDVAVSGSVVGFLVPAVSEGIYSVSMSLGSAGSFSINCAVRPVPAPLAAEQYVSNVQSRMTQMSQALGVLLDSLGTTPEAALIAQDHARLLEFADSLVNVVASASETEKQEFARIMAANEHYLVELSAEVGDLVAAVSQTHRAFVIDRETEWTGAAGVFVQRTAIALVKAALVGKILASSIGTGPWGTAAGGLAIFFIIRDIMGDVAAAKAAFVRLYNLSFLVHDQMDADVEYFQSGQDALIVVEATYRTIYLGDATAPTSNFIQRFITAYQAFRQRFSSFLASIPSSIRPAFGLAELPSSFSDAVRSVHTSWIQVTTSTSSADVTVQKFANSDGSTSLRFTNASNQERTVSYTMTYSHPDLTTLTRTLSATVSAGSVEDDVSYCIDVDPSNSGGYVPCVWDGWNVVSVAYSCGSVSLNLVVHRVDGVPTSATLTSNGVTSSTVNNTVIQDTISCPGTYGSMGESVEQMAFSWCGYNYSTTPVVMSFSSATEFNSADLLWGGLIQGSQVVLTYQDSEYVLGPC